MSGKISIVNETVDEFHEEIQLWIVHDTGKFIHRISADRFGKEYLGRVVHPGELGNEYRRMRESVLQHEATFIERALAI